MRRAVIFTAKATETEAVKAQLLGPIGNQKTAQTYVYDIYHIRRGVGSNEAVSDIEVALYETGRGQEKVMPAVPPIVTDFDPDLVLYIGCAGGDPEMIKMYDVLIPTDAWPYEKGKETKDGFKSRAWPAEPNAYLRDLAKSIAIRPRWRARIPSIFQVDSKGKQINSTVKLGMLASGNKILADDDGEVWMAVKTINDEIIAVETECFAFFKAMEPLHRPYLMIRGISDLLANKNTEGAQVDNDRQTRSTAHAAALATQLILEEAEANDSQKLTPTEDVKHPQAHKAHRGPFHKCKFHIVSTQYSEKGRWRSLADVLVEVLDPDLPNESWAKEAYLIPSALALPEVRDAKFLRDPQHQAELDLKKQITRRFVEEWKHHELDGVWFTMPVGKGKSSEDSGAMSPTLTPTSPVVSSGNFRTGLGVYSFAYDMFLNAEIVKKK